MIARFSDILASIRLSFKNILSVSIWLFCAVAIKALSWNEFGLTRLS
jgi:hypothetical protein